MNEHLEHNTSSAPPQVELDVAALLKRMQQQLVFLEKKIDTLIKQSSERPFKERHFSKPFRPGGFGHSHHPVKREHDNGPRESGFAQGHHFSRQQSGENRGFSQRKKPFFHERKDRG